jgi:glyoxylase-like metal-dependent hydrolase (beta-lactamase superfamily II)
MAAGPDRVSDFGDVRVEAFVTGTWNEICYVVTDRTAAETAVIDPGDEHERLIAHIEARGHRVRLILLTHAHYDHVGAVAALSRHTGLPCHVHRSDRVLLRRAPLYALSVEQKSIPLPKAVEAFDDGAKFELGARSFECAPCPGHTPGSVCFRYGDLLFVGDTLLRGERGRTDLPGGDAGVLEKSIAALLEQFEGDLALFPGHGEPWTLDEARHWWGEQEDRGPR